MSRRIYGYRAGLEELMEEVNAMEGQGPEEVGEPIPEYEEEEIEESSDADVVEEAVERVEEVAEGLESIKELMIKSLEDGGLSKQAATFAAFAIKTTAGNFIKVDTTAAGLESLEDDIDNVAATSIAIEGISDSIKSAWSKITTMVKTWITKIGEFWEGHKAEAARLQTGALALAGKASGRVGKMQKEELSISKTEFRNLVSNGAVAALPAGLKALTTVINKLGTENASCKIIKEFCGKVAAMKVGKEPDIKDLKGIGSPEAWAKKYSSASPIKMKEVKSGEDEVKLESNEVFLGETVVKAEFLGWHSVFLCAEVYTGTPEGVSLPKVASAVKALDAGEVAEIAREVAELAKAIKESKLNITERKTIINEIYNMEERLDVIGHNDPSAKSEPYKYMKEVLYGSKNLSFSLMEPDLSLHKQGLASAKAAYNYASKSLKNLKVEKAGKEE